MKSYNFPRGHKYGCNCCICKKIRFNCIHDGEDYRGEGIRTDYDTGFYDSDVKVVGIAVNTEIGEVKELIL